MLLSYHGNLNFSPEPNPSQDYPSQDYLLFYHLILADQSVNTEHIGWFYLPVINKVTYLNDKNTSNTITCDLLGLRQLHSLK